MSVTARSELVGFHADPGWVLNRFPSEDDFATSLEGWKLKANKDTVRHQCHSEGSLPADQRIAPKVSMQFSVCQL